MFIGNLVKLKEDVVRNNKDKEFVENGIKEGWIWLITAMDDEDLDFVIQPLYLDGENTSATQLGKDLLVLYDEIEKIEITREELFRILRNQSCN